MEEYKGKIWYNLLYVWNARKMMGKWRCIKIFAIFWDCATQGIDSDSIVYDTHEPQDYFRRIKTV